MSAPSFFILPVKVDHARQSLTAAVKTAASASENGPSQALSISAAVSTRTTSTPAGSASADGPETRVTCAPRSAACSASRYPVLPEAALEMKRTLSKDSRVGPAVTSRRFPSKSRSPPVSRTARTARATVSGSGNLPAPTLPHASSPSAGSTTKTPRSRKVAMFACVAGFSHICVFMAGTTTSGASVASAAAVTRLSAIPQASFAKVLAVHGAIA